MSGGNFELKISDEAFKSAMSEAILKHIDGETRDRLITEALKKLVEPQTIPGSYGRQPSIVEQSFARACSNVAGDVIRDLVQSDQALRERITDFCRTAITDLMDPQKNGALQQAFINAFQKALSGRDY